MRWFRKFEERPEVHTCAQYTPAPYSDFPHGKSATTSNPAFSSNPNMMFIFCTAWPEAPLVRLSITESTTRGSRDGGLNTETRQAFEPGTLRVCGSSPAGSTSTKGSLA